MPDEMEVTIKTEAPSETSADAPESTPSTTLEAVAVSQLGDLRETVGRLQAELATLKEAIAATAETATGAETTADQAMETAASAASLAIEASQEPEPESAEVEEVVVPPASFEPEQEPTRREKTLLERFL